MEITLTTTSRISPDYSEINLPEYPKLHTNFVSYKENLPIPNNNEVPLRSNPIFNSTPKLQNSDSVHISSKELLAAFGVVGGIAIVWTGIGTKPGIFLIASGLIVLTGCEAETYDLNAPQKFSETADAGHIDTGVLVYQCPTLGVNDCQRMYQYPDECDTDGDGIPNNREDTNFNCQTDSNETDARLIDTDNDGLIDSEDECPLNPDPECK